MGDSAPPSASIDLIGSFARRRGTDIEIVLWDPSDAQTSDTLRLRRGRQMVDGPVEFVEDDRGSRLIARLPRRQVTDGTWSVRLRLPGGGSHRVEARLLVQGDRPLVLLWGASAAPSEVPKQTAATGRRKAAATAGRALDRVLLHVPAENAVKTRSTIRRTARRLLR